MPTPSSVWERAARGQSSAVVGIRTLQAPRSLPLTVIRVACDGPRATLGPILAATERIEAVLGEPAPLLDQARRGALDLGRRILGDVGPARGARAAFLDAASRLAKIADGRTVLVFDAVDEADDATLGLLASVLSERATRLPLALGLRAAEPTGRAGELLRAARAAWGDDAILRAEEPPAAPEPAVDLRALPDDVRTVLRCAAVLGPTFDLDVLAEVLGLEGDEVLVRLQIARDRGVPIEDREDGLVSLPDALARALQGSTLSALRARWHARAGHALARGPREEAREPELAAATIEAEPPAPPPPAEPKAPSPEPPPRASIPPETSRSSPGAPAPRAPFDTRPSAAEVEGLRRAPAEPEVPSATQPDDGVLRGDRRSPSDPPEAEAPAAQPAPVVTDEPTLEAAPSFDEPKVRVVSAPPVSARAAGEAIGGTRIPVRGGRASRAAPEEASEHFFEAGELGLAVRKLIEGAEQACSLGAHAEAQGHAHRALEMLRRVPRSNAARELELRALAALGRAHLEGIGASGFDLQTAIEKLEAAKRLLSPADGPDLHVLVAELLATAHYEVGDLPSLERALEELTVATRALLAGKHAHHAARLLNDQAAIYIRMGDPVRAMALLSESRRIYEDRAATDEVARREMAQTDHLIAAVPLHVPAKPGRTDDALSSALDHAKAALRTYERLGAAVQAARVRETMGRLELRRGRPERALEHLQAALDVEQRHGDVIGLARASAAFAELLATAGRLRDALVLLGESISLNRRKGSAIGVAFNRRTLAALARAVGPDPHARAMVRELEAALAEAEAEVGRVALPGEREP